MEKYEEIIVNNLICESLHPNNMIAQLYYKEDYKNNKINKNERKGKHLRTLQFN